jgi:hypothetical protein
MGKFEFFLIQAVLLVSEVIQDSLSYDGLELLASPGSLISCALGWLLNILLSALLKYVKNVEILFLKINTATAL